MINGYRKQCLVRDISTLITPKGCALWYISGGVSGYIYLSVVCHYQRSPSEFRQPARCCPKIRKVFPISEWVRRTSELSSGPQPSLPGSCAWRYLQGPVWHWCPVHVNVLCLISMMAGWFWLSLSPHKIFNRSLCLPICISLIHFWTQYSIIEHQLLNAYGNRWIYILFFTLDEVLSGETYFTSTCWSVCLCVRHDIKTQDKNKLS